jgi:hypothetical protein
MMEWNYYASELFGNSFWVRLWRGGPGVAVRKNSLMLFSERRGDRKVLRVGSWAFEYLPRCK